MKYILSFLLFALLFTSIPVQAQQPNILLVIADDLGVDVSRGYHDNPLMPTTPTLDQLRAEGITFENVFSAPKCTPTRAAIMSGLYGIKTGVTGTPGNLDLTYNSIFDEIETRTEGAYADAVIGKWHISGSSDPDHPMQHGVDFYMGLIGSSVADYYNWNKTQNGTTTLEESYVTSTLTDTAVQWVEDHQDQPWFLWLAHAAPHSPFHEPPRELYTIGGTGTNYRKYIAMIEALDTELNRLLESMTAEVRENTLIIYIGDNGTPGTVLQDYPTGHGKSTLYQGGIRVPMIISGAGVSRKGERESALVHVTDIHATLIEATGSELPGGIRNSLSFYNLLSGEPSKTRDYNYSEIDRETRNGWTLRNTRYKLIQFTDGVQEFYDLQLDSLEENNLLLGALTEDQLLIKTDLEQEADQIRNSWSCRDHIQNGDEEDIDCGGSECMDCSTTAAEDRTNPIDILVNPNPASSILSIHSTEKSMESIKIYDLQGRLVEQYSTVQSNLVNIDVSNLASDLYMILIQHPSGRSVVKIVKE